MLDHAIQEKEYNNGIISGLAVIGIHPTQGWVDALNYTPKLSAVVKLARIMVVQHAWEKYQSRRPGSSESCFEETRRMVNRFMVIDEPVPMF